MPADELAGPTGYSALWLILALLGLVLVLAYYAAVLLVLRPRQGDAGRRHPRDVPRHRSIHLARLDQIEAEVRGGRRSARSGHQALSEALRSYVGSVSSMPAPTMALDDFKQRAPAALTSTIELMYPPEFATDEEGQAEEHFDDALGRARKLVTQWS